MNRGVDARNAAARSLFYADLIAETCAGAARPVKRAQPFSRPGAEKRD